MKTQDLYFATLSIIVNKDAVLCMREAPYKEVLVRKKGKYPDDVYYDIYRKKTYGITKQGLGLGDVYIDTLRGFNYVTGNIEENLPKKKVLEMFDKVVGGK